MEDKNLILTGSVVMVRMSWKIARRRREQDRFRDLVRVSYRLLAGAQKGTDSDKIRATIYDKCVSPVSSSTLVETPRST